MKLISAALTDVVKLLDALQTKGEEWLWWYAEPPNANDVWYTFYLYILKRIHRAYIVSHF